MFNRFVVVATLAFAIACGKSATPTTPSSSTASTTVAIAAGSRLLTTTAYNPNPIAITRGMSVTWVNNDSIAHSSTSDTGAWDSGIMAAGQSFTMTFPSAGTFTYHCSIHPNMVGTVNVQ